jgi:hypothetical protein
VPAVTSTLTSSDWSSGGALLTFYFPIVLFAVIAIALYLQFSRPHTVPGHRPFTEWGQPGPRAGGSAPSEQDATGTDPDNETPGAGA